MTKAIFKFNNGNGALLCSKCRIIIKTGKNFTPEEKKAFLGQHAITAQYCDHCKKLQNP